ncbi:hypothetical protein FKM82_025434 [Ascaphus truei]
MMLVLNRHMINETSWRRLGCMACTPLFSTAHSRLLPLLYSSAPALPGCSTRMFSGLAAAFSNTAVSVLYSDDSTLLVTQRVSPAPRFRH